MFTELFKQFSIKIDHEEDFYLDDVNVNKINFYAEDTTEITDNIEILLKRIDDEEIENKQLKNETTNFRSENEFLFVKMNNIEKDHKQQKNEI